MQPVNIFNYPSFMLPSFNPPPHTHTHIYRHKQTIWWNLIILVSKKTPDDSFLAFFSHIIVDARVCLQTYFFPCFFKRVTVLLSVTKQFLCSCLICFRAFLWNIINTRTSPHGFCVLQNKKNSNNRLHTSDNLQRNSM